MGFIFVKWQHLTTPPSKFVKYQKKVGMVWYKLVRVGTVWYRLVEVGTGWYRLLWVSTG